MREIQKAEKPAAAVTAPMEASSLRRGMVMASRLSRGNQWHTFGGGGTHQSVIERRQIEVLAACEFEISSVVKERLCRLREQPRDTRIITPSGPVYIFRFPSRRLTFRPFPAIKPV